MEERDVILNLQAKGLDTIGKIETELKKVNKELKDVEINSDAFDTLNKEAIVLKRGLDNVKGSQKQLADQSKIVVGSLNAQRKVLSDLTKERNNLNRTTAEGAKRFDELQKEIKSLNDEIKSAEQTGGDFRRNVGNYGDALKGAALDANVMGVSVGGLTSQVSSMINPVTAGIAAIGALGAAYLKSARGAKDLQAAVDQVDFVITKLGNSLADAFGEGDGLFETLTQGALNLIDPTLAAQAQIVANLKLQLREWELVNLETERNKKINLDLAEQQRQIRDDDRNAIEVREAANIRLGEIVDIREQEVVAQLEKKKGILLALLSINKGDLELRQQIRQVEFEIADIQEETSGFESEQKANELALAREVSEQELALLAEQIEGELLLTMKGSKDELDLKLKLIKETSQLELDAAGQNELKKKTILQNSLNEQLKAYQEYYKGIQLAALQTEGIETAANKEASDKFVERVGLEINALADRNKANAESVEQAKKSSEEVQQAIEQAFFASAQIISDTLGSIASGLEKEAQDSADRATEAEERGAGNAVELRKIAEENAESYKRVARLQAYVDTLASTVAAYNSTVGIPIVGPVLAPIAAAAAFASGIARVQQIDAQGFAQGGVIKGGKSTQRSNGDDVVITAKRGEAILNASQQHAIGKDRLARAGVPGFASGGLVGDVSQPVINQAEQMNAFNDIMRNLPTPVVDVTQINRTQKAVQVKQRYAQL
jgi:Mg2+ and Co2+ transporter CorA